jgi:hypothetical protein
LPHFVERSADTCHAALAKMTSAVGVPGPAPFTKSLPARVGKLKPSKADHRAKRIVSRWPSRTRSLIARGPPAGSSISAEAWRSWHRFGFIACPASKRRQLATVGAHARSSTRKSFFLWTGNSPRRGVVNLERPARPRRSVRFLVTLLGLFRNHGAAAPIHGAMVCHATRTGDPRT